MDYGWLNVGGIVFGLLAWALPLIAISKFVQNNEPHGTCALTGSFVSALVSLLFVIVYTRHLIDIEDWSALMDTKRAFSFSTTVMSVVTIALNGLALMVKTKCSKKN